MIDKLKAVNSYIKYTAIALYQQTGGLYETKQLFWICVISGVIFL